MDAASATLHRCLKSEPELFSIRCINNPILGCLDINLPSLGSAPAKHRMPIPKNTNPGINGRAEPINPKSMQIELMIPNTIRKNIVTPFVVYLGSRKHLPCQIVQGLVRMISCGLSSLCKGISDQYLVRNATKRNISCPFSSGRLSIGFT